MNAKLEQKLFYTLVGSSFGLLNIYLINTRFNIVGLGFGILGAGLLIKALLIRADK
jgi:hypothetical protein